MAEQETILLGIVGIKNMGVYNSETAYEKLNVVTYEGSSYCAITDTQGHLPTDTNYWQLYAQKGDTGPQGPKPVKDVDYWTEEDKEEIESDLVDDIQESVQNEVIRQIGNISSGNPLPAQTLADMVDTTRIYLLLTDGYIYYYNGTDWVQGWVYQSTQIADNAIFTQNLEPNIQKRIRESVDYREISSFSSNVGRLVDNNGVLQSTNQYNACLIDVKENDKLHIKCGIDTASTAYTIIYLNNSTVVSRIDKMNSLSDTTYEKDITIPAGVNKVGINYRNTYGCSVNFLNIVDSVKLKNNNDNMLNVIAPYKEVTPLSVVNGYITVEKSAQSISFTTHDNFVYKKYDITELDNAIVKYESNSIATVYSIIITDDNGVVLFIEDYQPSLPNNSLVVKPIYNVPNGKYLYIQASKNKLLDIYSRNYSEVNEIIEEKYNELKQINKYDKFAISNLERRCFNLEKKNPFQFGQFDKTYFCFVIDDCNSYFPKAVEIFLNNNVPLSSATLIERLNNVYTNFTPNNTKTVKELLQDLVQYGGEVLAHYAGNLAPPGTPDTDRTHYLTTPEDWLSKTRDVKMTLEENGFEVRGIITADSTIARTSTGQKYCSLYFDYSDTLGTSPNFSLGRRKFFLASDMQTVAQVKSYIDTCCQTPGFYPFCFHGNRSDEPLINETDLNEILTYINNKGSNVCVCTTYSYVIDTFGSSSLEERLSALEN